MIPIETFLDDTNHGHSPLQMDRFITIRAGGTLYGCYHQACRELSTRVAALVECLTERESLGLRIALAERRIGRTRDDLRRGLIGVKLARLRFSAAQLDHRLIETRNEFIRFYSQCAALYRALGFDLERPTPERLAELEAERWEHNIRCQIALDLFTAGRPSRTTAEALQSLPADMRKRIGDDCLAGPDAQQRCIAWYFDFVPPVPEPLALSPDEQRELVQCCESSLSPRLSATSSPTAAPPSRAINTASDSKSATAAPLAAESPAPAAGVCCP